jgi:hypothetical protein
MRGPGARAARPLLPDGALRKIRDVRWCEDFRTVRRENRHEVERRAHRHRGRRHATAVSPDPYRHAQSTARWEEQARAALRYLQGTRK